MKISAIVLDVTTCFLQAIFADVLARENRFQAFGRSGFQHLGIVARDDAQSPLAVRKVVVAQAFSLGKNGFLSVVAHRDDAEIIVGGAEFFAGDFIFGCADDVTLLSQHRFIADFQADKVCEHPFETLVIATYAFHVRFMRDEATEIGMNLDF